MLIKQNYNSYAGHNRRINRSCRNLNSVAHITSLAARQTGGINIQCISVRECENARIDYLPPQPHEEIVTNTPKINDKEYATVFDDYFIPIASESNDEEDLRLLYDAFKDEDLMLCDNLFDLKDQTSPNTQNITAITTNGIFATQSSIRKNKRIEDNYNYNDDDDVIDNHRGKSWKQKRESTPRNSN